jgi:hypothetical protein
MRAGWIWFEDYDFRKKKKRINLWDLRENCWEFQKENIDEKDKPKHYT